MNAVVGKTKIADIKAARAQYGWSLATAKGWVDGMFADVLEAYKYDGEVLREQIAEERKRVEHARFLGNCILVSPSTLTPGTRKIAEKLTYL